MNAARIPGWSISHLERDPCGGPVGVDVPRLDAQGAAQVLGIGGHRLRRCTSRDRCPHPPGVPARGDGGRKVPRVRVRGARSQAGRPEVSTSGQARLGSECPYAAGIDQDRLTAEPLGDRGDPAVVGGVAEVVPATNTGSSCSRSGGSTRTTKSRIVRPGAARSSGTVRSPHVIGASTLASTSDGQSTCANLEDREAARQRPSLCTRCPPPEEKDTSAAAVLMTRSCGRAPSCT